jgi:hypothetical protein
MIQKKFSKIKPAELDKQIGIKKSILICRIKK